MPKITNIEVQKKNPHRFNLFLDEIFAFGADEDTLAKYHLLVGQEIADNQLTNILYETEVGKLIERVYLLFAKRQRSEKEIRDYLKNLSFKNKLQGKEEISLFVIENLIARLKRKQLINDQDFAQLWVESRRRNKKKGLNSLKMELYQKGIGKEIIEQILAQISPAEEKQLAKKALEKKLPIWKNLTALEFKKKALEFLLRKGFGYPLSYEVVADLLKK